ncbi:MAG: hypothetical protein HY898_30840 [Deltaproteobacteria bacterium]|nr:hypothetical protein [Deltaproteobacteria bacterium]
MDTRLNDYEQAVAGAIIAIDTLWGGDVNCRSGMGRVIADSYFSGKDLPECYTGEAADKLRKSGGVSAKQPDREAIRSYLATWKPADQIDRIVKHASTFEPMRRSLVLALADTMRVQLDLAMELLGDGPPVAYERCVIASTGEPAREASTKAELEQVRDLLGQLGEKVPSGSGGLLEAIDAWRGRTWVGHEGIDKANQRVISELEALVLDNFVRHLPEELKQVPRANVKFILLKEAWFSGSMNYIGRARKPDGTPEYEAEYELNASIQKSQAEFLHLVSHEVVPGHVTTFAFIQNQYHRGLLGFESTILTMNTRHSTLFEGIANAALVMAHGVRTPEELPNPEMRLGLLLSQLEDIAKNNASFYTWALKMPPEEIKRRLRSDCLASQERADKLTDAWAKHALMGRAYMPSYLFGTDLVLRLLREHGPEKMIPIFYGLRGLCDCVTIHDLVAQA